MQVAPAVQQRQEHHAAASAEESVGKPCGSACNPRRGRMFHTLTPKSYVLPACSPCAALQRSRPAIGHGRGTGNPSRSPWGLLQLEALAVGALDLGGVGLVGADLDGGQAAVVLVLAVVGAVADGALAVEGILKSQ